MNILNNINGKFLFMDGSMGTILQNSGLQAGEIPEEYNIEHPELIKDIHKSYIEAGSNIITTNTFGANRYKLSSSKYTVNEIISSGIKNAKAVTTNQLVALDIGPIGQLLSPSGFLSFDEAYDIFREQITIGAENGADIILIETMSDIYEAKVAVLAAKENCTLPVFCTMTFQEDMRTLTGTDPITMVKILEGLGVDALGINCSLGPDQLLPIVSELIKYSNTPIIIQPNAGLPSIVDGETQYSLTPNDFAKALHRISALGCSILGGCCGTTPSHISQMIKLLENTKPQKNTSTHFASSSSSTKTSILSDDITIIGERINPTGKKDMQTSIKNNDFSYIINEAIYQTEKGANILNINFGIPGVDEVQTMKKAILSLQAVIDTPLSIDSMKPEVIETALRYYNGLAIINSVNGKQESMDKIFPLAKKYGSSIIALTLDESGLPTTVQQRLDIADKIINEARKYDIPKERLIFDCLTLTASSMQSSILQTLQAIKLIKEKYGVKTTLGASNISYGLPNREILNATFLAMALSYGLDAPITDPTVKSTVDTINSYRVLANIDHECTDYISKYTQNNIKKNNNPQSKSSLNLISLKEVVVKGLKNLAQEKTLKLLSNEQPMDIVDNHLIAALDIVGNQYENGDIFLPQLLNSAETVKIAFDTIKKSLHKQGILEVSKGKVILATVKGDVHDIGKNIVKVLLENYGYTVIDLGKDVSSDTIIDAAITHNVKLIGLSALMTTTVKSMESTINDIKHFDSTIKVMVGGAVLTENYAKKIGAHFYGKDAREAVNIAKKILS